MRIDYRRRVTGEWPIGAVLLAFFMMGPVFGLAVQHDWLRLGGCTLNELTGVPCLTCGSTRATLYLFEGDVLTALSYQPLMMALYLGVVVWGAVSFYSFLRGRVADIELQRDDWQIVTWAFFTVPLLNWLYLFFAGV